jgi:hypothetical protein
MNDLDPNCFGLRQADQAREAYAQVMEELDLVRSSWPGSDEERDPSARPGRPGRGRDRAAADPVSPKRRLEAIGVVALGFSLY